MSTSQEERAAIDPTIEEAIIDNLDKTSEKKGEAAMNLEDNNHPDLPVTKMIPR
jgi:hypothetical protein